jgi:NAD+ diphosphatase
MLVCSSVPPGRPSGPATLISVRGSRVSLTHDAEPPAGAAEPLWVGELDGQPCWAFDSGADAGADDEGAPHTDLMTLFGSVDEATWAAAGRAVQLVEWRRNHRFCGRCGTATEESDSERSRCCPSCGSLAFPRLAPAVIALVERADGRALLARNSRWPTNMYSCLAGFVEPGESVEDALRREIHEEVGIRVGRVRYWGSQPWPFPHSLMLGFHAEYLDGEIDCDGEEIADAGWYAADGLPSLPGRISIARRLIDDWLARS